MKDKVYVGALVSDDELSHSAKGSTWKKHKYTAIINGVYQYPKKKMEKYRARQNAKELENEYYELYKKYDEEAKEAEERAETFKRQRLEEDSGFDNYTSALHPKLEPTGSTNANLAGREAIKAKGKRYMANQYGKKTAEQKFIASDRDIVDRGIDAVAGAGKKISSIYKNRKKQMKKKR